MWFGTRNGVSRYDDTGFTTYTVEDGLAGYRVMCMLEDRQGDLWFGTERGISRYDGHTFETFAPETDLGLEGGQVSTILQDRSGHLWFGTRYNGMSRYDGQSFTPLRPRMVSGTMRCVRCWRIGRAICGSGRTRGW
jgi:ligand-binding sensor domain-containing protein